MEYFAVISDWILPVVIVYIVLYGFWKKVPVYHEFIEGVKGGFKIVIDIAPTLVGLLTAVSFARISGFLEIVADVISPVTEFVKIPSEIIPLAIVKMFSSSAATGMALDIFRTYGTDSYLGMCASIMLSCTETIFYTMSVYYMSVKVTKTRWTLPGALFTTIVGIIVSVLIAGVVT